MITFQTYGEESECKELWNQYSPKKIMWDVWEFRRCFHTKDSEFNFILCFENGKEIGLLPLIFDRKEKIYTYFGDTFPEKNKFWLISFLNRSLGRSQPYICTGIAPFCHPSEPK